MYMFIREKELERDPDAMRGRKMVEARFAIISGIYPDFYGWLYYYFVAFLLVIYPGLYSYFFLAYALSFYYGMKYSDIPLMGQVLCLGTTTFIYGFVSLNFIAKKTDMDELMKLVGRGFTNDYSRPKTEQEKSIMDRMVKSTHSYAMKSTMLITFSISFAHMGVLPILRGIKGEYSSITNDTAPINKNTPLPIWTPYECNTLGPFVFSYFAQLIPGCMECNIINACCIIYIGFSQQLSGSLEILTNSLRDLPARALYMFETEGGIANGVTDELYGNRHFLRCLNACMTENVKHHTNLIEYHKKLQDVMGFSVLAIFSGTGIFISTAAYSMLITYENESSIEVLICNTFVWSLDLCVYVFLLAVYCHYGQRVTDQNEELLVALYDTPWLEADMPFRRSVLISMSYSQISMELTAMGLVTASYETLLEIIKTSFSYLNLLLAARD